MTASNGGGKGGASPPYETALSQAQTDIALVQVDAPISAELPPKSSRRYALGEVIGRGGMGEVRVARDLRVGRTVAVKVLRNEGLTSSELRARFLREARVQGRLEHPAIVPVYDLDVDDEGHPFFVMKRLTGLTLSDILDGKSSDPAREGRWARRALLTRFVDVCLAIEFAHVRGVFHRDLKPQNIMLGDFGEVYVLDWGIAHLTGDDAGSRRDSAEPLAAFAGHPETASGALLGTPGYMAPEQIRGEKIGRAADVYSLGCVLFEIIAGEPTVPRGPHALEASLDADAHSPSERQPTAQIPPELDQLCVRATRSDVSRRIASAAELAAGVQRYLDGDRDEARRAELADEHVARANEALAHAGDAPRAVAMREAGLALSLVPADARAQAIVGRLLLEPPTTMPSEVRTSLAAARDVAARAHMRSAGLTYLSFFAFLPLFHWIAIVAWWPVIAMLTTAAVNYALLFAISRRPNASVNWVYAVLVIHCANIAATGILASTLLMLPAMAVTGVSSFLSNPRVRAVAPVLVMHLLALFVPIGLELAGVMHGSFQLDPNAVVIRPWAVSASSTLIIAAPLLAAISHLAATTFIVRGLRRTEEAAQDSLHLNKWHLEQLLPLR